MERAEVKVIIIILIYSRKYDKINIYIFGGETMKFKDGDVLIEKDKVEEKKEDTSKIEKEINDQIHTELDTSKLLKENGNTNKSKNNPKKNNSIFLASIVGISALVIGIIGGYVYGSNENKITDPDLIKIIECYETLNEGWYYGKTKEDVTNIVTDIMTNSFQSVDKYTFVTPNMSSQNLGRDGVGLGAKPLIVPKGILLSEVYSSSPLKEHDVKAGDVITAIEVGGVNYKLEGRSFEELQTILDAALKQESKYYIDVSGTVKTIDITPENVAADSAWLLKKDVVNGKKVLAIRIDSFLGDPYTEVIRILDNELKDDPDVQIETLIIDVRNNTGGYINQMYNISCLFAPKGSVIYATKDKNDRIIEKGVQKNNPRYNINNFKLLQNGMSASASEALGLSLIQNNDAKVYGFTSYGKGIAQTFFTFKDGSVLRYTYGKVFGPDQKTSIHGVGIATDYSSSSKDYKPLPYYYDQCTFTKDDYMNYLSYIYENLVYLGYEKPESLNDGLMKVVNQFQEDYGYKKSEYYDDEVSKQIMYETYVKVNNNMNLELEDVINDRF